MKTQSAHRTRGFTLVELLVVITIIAILAGAGFAAGNAAIQKAKKTTTLAAAVAIETAVNNFYTEYGYMPKDGDADVETDTKTDVTLLKELLGQNEADTALNTKKLKLLNTAEAKNKKSGLIYSTDGATVEGMVDAWGGPFYIMMDLDFNEKVTVKPKAVTTAKTLNRRVAVWSNGADCTTSSATGKSADDVITW